MGFNHTTQNSETFKRKQNGIWETIKRNVDEIEMISWGPSQQQWWSVLQSAGYQCSGCDNSFICRVDLNDRWPNNWTALEIPHALRFQNSMTKVWNSTCHSMFLSAISEIYVECSRIVNTESLVPDNRNMEYAGIMWPQSLTILKNCFLQIILIQEKPAGANFIPQASSNQFPSSVELITLCDFSLHMPTTAETIIRHVISQHFTDILTVLFTAPHHSFASPPCLTWLEIKCPWVLQKARTLGSCDVISWNYMRCQSERH